mmetsp:Transcript_33504/g.45568  ORF Transcript_33504/g.45568 Transcript_33504/m.45568 type:complete len:130 (-) Transcript_33504:201-590(-)
MSHTGASAGAPVRAQLRPRQAEAPSNGYPTAAHRCQDCGSADGDVFRDKSDGKKYCGTCWASYYGRPPPQAAKVASTGNEELPRKQRKCGECRSMNDKLFLDRKDGVEYCRSCWTAYYGQAPSDAWQGA